MGTGTGDSQHLHHLIELPKEPVQLRQNKTDNNLLLLKCELEDAGHGGKSGRDSAIEEIAFDYSFILKISKKLNI